MIGLKRGTVKLAKHNPKWQQSFEQEKKKLKKVFGKDALDIQHVGSTAIAGMLAKPIIDIGLIVRSLQKTKLYEAKLKKIGYFIKKDDAKKKDYFLQRARKVKERIICILAKLAKVILKK